MTLGQVQAIKPNIILRAFPTRATRLSSLLCERSEREISKLSKAQICSIAKNFGCPTWSQVSKSKYIQILTLHLLT